MRRLVLVKTKSSRASPARRRRPGRAPSGRNLSNTASRPPGRSTRAASPQAAGGIGDHLQHHVEDGGVEGAVRQVERHAVHHPEFDPGAGVGLGLPQHGGRQVGRQNLDVPRDERQVRARAAADDHQPLARLEGQQSDRAPALRGSFVTRS